MPTIRLSVRELVEFLLRTGSIDSRFTGFDRANEGARIHRRLQKAAGEGYAAEVFLTAERTMEGIGFTIEGRADGIFTDEDGTVVIDEIKTTAVPAGDIAVDVKGSPAAGAEAANVVEQPRGECYYYARGNGSKFLDRMRMRTPTSQNLAGMATALAGCDLADVNMIVLTIDPCISCTER